VTDFTFEENKGHVLGENSTSLTYLNNQSKLLLTSGSQLKLIHRKDNKFDIKNEGSFNYYPQKEEDLARIKLNNEDLKFLVRHLDWSLVPLN